MTTKKQDTTKLAINYKYINTELDLTKDTFKEAIDNENYVVNACWLNTLYEFEKDTLLSTTKQRNVITRQKIQENINRTEENIKEGLTFEDVIPFFHKIQTKTESF